VVTCGYLAGRKRLESVRELRFPAEQFASKASVTDAQIGEYYQANRTQFEIPESVRVEYVVLSPETISGSVTITEEAAKNCLFRATQKMRTALGEYV
jgi:peptidyl-prolyl cis-trans isomerase D